MFFQHNLLFSSSGKIDHIHKKEVLKEDQFSMPPERWKLLMGFSADLREICCKHTSHIRMRKRHI